MAGVVPNAIGELLKHGTDPSVISFAGGYPDASLFPVEGIRAVMDELLDGRHNDALQYTVSGRAAGAPRAGRPTLKSLDTQGRVIHLGSFSKILAPGMRLGWAIAAPDILARLGLLKLAADTQCSTLNMAAAAAFMERYDIHAHIDHMCGVYKRKRDLMLDSLEEHMPPGVTWTHPIGDLFTWLTLPDGFDASAFARDQALPIAKVAYVPGATFFPVEQEPNHARVNFSGTTDANITEGVRRLGTVLRKTLPG